MNSCFGCLSEKPKEQPAVKSTSPPKSRSPSIVTPSVEHLDRNILLLQLRAVWSSDLNMARDLPRLSSRVVFRDANGETNKIEEKAFPEDDTLAETCKRCVLAVASRLEPVERTATLQEGLMKVFNNAGNSDVQLLVEDAFSNHLSKDGKTYRLLRTIHPEIIVPAATYIKTAVFGVTHSLTRDVHGPEGWKIVVDFSNPNRIRVTHVRREVSMDSGKNSFSMEWNLNLLFDRDVTEMQAASFKIVDLKLNPEMDQDRQAGIRRVLIDDLREAASDDNLEDLKI